MKVGIIRGPFLNKWEMQTYEFIQNHDINLIGIVPKNHFYDLNRIKFPIIKTDYFGHYNVIPYLNSVIQKRFNLNYYLFNFKKIIKNMDLLHTAEIFHIFTQQAINTNKPTIVTIWENIPFNFYEKPFLKIINSTLQNASHFIAITKGSKLALNLQGISSKRISIIPAGVDVNKFHPNPKNSQLLKMLKIPEKSRIILFVGRLVWEKGIYNLIYAFNDLIRNDHKDLILLIVGNGIEKQEINNLIIKLKLEKYVRFIRKIPYEKIPNIYNIADILCVPSIPTRYWKEQFGLVFVEAMACGKPVVSTFSGSIPEVIDHKNSGLLVQPMDNVELANSLKFLLDEDLEKWGENARNLVVKKFNSEKLAEKLARLYLKCI